MKKLLIIILICLSGKAFSQQGQFRKLDSTIVGTYATGATTAAMDFFVVSPFLKEAMARYSSGSIVMMVYDTANLKYGWQTIPSGGSSQWTTTGSDIYYNTGGVAIGATSVNSVSILDLTSTTKGLRLPRMTSAQRTAITAVAGLLVFDTDSASSFQYTGSAWQNLYSTGGGGSSGITVGTTTITSGTSGRIGFNLSGIYTESANLVWDNPNANLGIGATPAAGYRLDIYKNTNGVTSFRVKNDNAGSSAQVQTVLENNGGSLAYFGISSSAFSGFAPLNSGKANFGGYNVPVSIFTQTNFPIEFYSNAVYRGEISNGGDWQLGSSTGHAGSQTLQVTGDASVTGVTSLGSGVLSNSTVSIAGSLSKIYVGKTTTYTATSGDDVIDCASGTFTVTLPTAVGITGREYTIKNSGAGVITVDADGTETIDGATTVTLSTQYNSISIRSNGANWITEATLGSSATDLAYTASPTNGIVTSSTGTDATIPLATTTNAGLMPPFTESTYTPTLTNTTNIAASTASALNYSRVGDWVTVWGVVQIDATTLLTLSEMGISLYTACDITAESQLSGTITFEDNTTLQVKGDVTNNRAVARGTPQSASNNTYSVFFTYRQIDP